MGKDGGLMKLKIACWYYLWKTFQFLHFSMMEEYFFDRVFYYWMKRGGYTVKTRTLLDVFLSIDLKMIGKEDLIIRLCSILKVIYWQKRSDNDSVINWEYLNALYDNSELRGELNEVKKDS